VVDFVAEDGYQHTFGPHGAIHWLDNLLAVSEAGAQNNAQFKESA